MSRISRYQESINRFIKNKSCINEVNEKDRNEIHDIIKKSENMPSIILLTVMGNRGRKNNVSLHGYYMAAGIQLLEVVARLMEKEQGCGLISKLVGLTNICLLQNMESIQSQFPKDTIVRIWNNSMRIANTKIYNLVKDNDIQCEAENIRETDIIKYHFSNINADFAKNKLMSLKKIKYESLMQFIQDKYGTVCKTALLLGWIMGGGDDKMIKTLEKTGMNMALMLKTSYDFINLESDLEMATGCTKNLIINLGFQNTFELFVDNKQKFIEGCISLDIYTNTMKEIIDLMENKIDTIIDRTSPDLRSHYTLHTTDLCN